MIHKSISKRSLRALSVAIVAACHSPARCSEPLAPNLDDSVEVPEGFKATLFADDDLAHDVYAMTVDSLGRVVVSGRGYVRILIDANGDGRADSFKQYADGPKSGAQGLFFHGRDLICTGDDGLIRYRDRDGDDRADGPPEVFLRIKTGGEHHVHAVRKGPDGWWYLIAGNFAGVTSAYATLPTSPVKSPQSGTLLRLKPNLDGGEIVCDGYRNAYDFDFNPAGDVFVYDSDGERDVSLPWYRPTRVFQALPAAHAGWISRSWKRPDDFADMPPVVGAFGRGSPTGVCCYRHDRFPEKYRGAVFVLDWTFGRVIAMPLTPDGSTYRSKPIDFMTGVGQFGFAPTDAAVGRDGSLYVSVGGRGTRGGVYRVVWTGKNAASKSGKTELDRCLAAPQPLSSWSRAAWSPLARKLGSKTFVAAALHSELPAGHRVRAIEILTEMFAGLPDDALERLAKDAAWQVRARAAWSHGRTHAALPNARLLRPLLTDVNAHVRRAALEALLGGGERTDFDAIVKPLARTLSDRDRFVRETAARLAARLPRGTYRRLQSALPETDRRGMLSLDLSRVLRARDIDLSALETGARLLSGKQPADVTLDAVRLMQLALGDVGGGRRMPLVYDGYASRLDLAKYAVRLGPYRGAVTKGYPTGDDKVDWELARLIAMLATNDADLIDKLLKQINAASHPIADIHHLIVLSRIPAERHAVHTQAVANALVGVQAKIDAGDLKQDSNWDDRYSEMYRELVRHDPALPAAVIRHKEFGRPSHTLFLAGIDGELRRKSIDSFARQITADDEYPWTNEVVFLLASSRNADHRELIRRQHANFAVQGAVLLSLSKNAVEPDRKLFVAGLESSQLNVLEACLKALAELTSTEDAADQVALVKALRRLGSDRREYPAREQVVRLLQRNNERSFGFVFGSAGHKPQSAVANAWTDWVVTRFPKQAARKLGSGDALVELKKQLAAVDFASGDRTRGRLLFQKRGCVQCHGGQRSLGPDLAGVARRFSRADLFIAMALPNRDVSSRYQTTLIQTHNGKTYTGLAIYDSVDGVTLRDGLNRTFRIEATDIAARRKLAASLMPVGLLKGLRPQDLADLYAYLRTL